LLTSVAYFYAGLAEKGLGYFGKYIKPTPILLPININLKYYIIGKSKRVVALWLQLFSEILEDEQLTGKLWNTLKLLMGSSGDSNEELVVNLRERRTDRVKRIT
jgi:F-type H+-transporting ATPase subunit a